MPRHHVPAGTKPWERSADADIVEQIKTDRDRVRVRGGDGGDILSRGFPEGCLSADAGRLFRRPSSTAPQTVRGLLKHYVPEVTKSALMPRPFLAGRPPRRPYGRTWCAFWRSTARRIVFGGSVDGTPGRRSPRNIVSRPCRAPGPMSPRFRVKRADRVSFARTWHLPGVRIASPPLGLALPAGRVLGYPTLRSSPPGP